MDISALSIGNHPPHEVNVFIEISKGAKEKHEWISEKNELYLKRTITADVSYPGDYGCIPGTLAADGDMLDAMVISSTAHMQMSVVSARPIGVLKIIDKGVRDDKIFCVPINDDAFKAVADINDCDPEFLKNIIHFFSVYKDPGEKVTILGWGNGDEAKETIMSAKKESGN